MSEFETTSIVPKADHPLLAEPRAGAAHDSNQRKLMLGSLCLLLVALSIVLWQERDFWFPDSPEADSDQPAENIPDTRVASQPSAASTKMTAVTKPKHQA